MKFNLSIVDGYPGTKERVILEKMGYEFGPETNGLAGDPEIEFQSFEEFEAFIREIGAIVIQFPYDKSKPLLDLQIYNDYRE